MILGKPTLQTVLDLLEDEGCPACGDQAGPIQINGPDEIVLVGCGHVVDAKDWLDGFEVENADSGNYWYLGWTQLQ